MENLLKSSLLETIADKYFINLPKCTWMPSLLFVSAYPFLCTIYFISTANHRQVLMSVELAGITSTPRPLNILNWLESSSPVSLLSNRQSDRPPCFCHRIKPTRQYISRPLADQTLYLLFRSIISTWYLMADLSV